MRSKGTRGADESRGGIYCISRVYIGFACQSGKSRNSCSSILSAADVPLAAEDKVLKTSRHPVILYFASLPLLPFLFLTKRTKNY